MLSSSPFYAWIIELFPGEDEPFATRDILTRLHTKQAVSRSAIYRAIKALRASSATCDRVRPLNEGEKRLLYNAEAAQLIARWATRTQVPKNRR